MCLEGKVCKKVFDYWWGLPLRLWQFPQSKTMPHRHSGEGRNDGEVRSSYIGRRVDTYALKAREQATLH